MQTAEEIINYLKTQLQYHQKCSGNMRISRDCRDEHFAIANALEDIIEQIERHWIMPLTD